MVNAVADVDVMTFALFASDPEVYAYAGGNPERLKQTWELGAHGGNAKEHAWRQRAVARAPRLHAVLMLRRMGRL